ncbi:hypothetical protein PO124_03485 [Bacillus licheniformis]|nr:hypothetical protein [Bacillus licheniformis]
MPDFKKRLSLVKSPRTIGLAHCLQEENRFAAYDDGHVGRFSKCSLDFRRLLALLKRR